MELQVSTDVNVVAESLKKQYDKELNELKKKLDESLRLQANSEEKEEKLKAAIASREEISKKHMKTLQAKHIAMKKLLAKIAKSDAKMAEVQKEHVEFTTALRKAKRSQRDTESEILRKSEVLGMNPGIEAFEANARAIAASAELVDSSKPIVVRSNHFEWTTVPIRIFDSDGSLLPLNFGEFKITLRAENGVLVSRMEPMSPLPPTDATSGYAHPHVKSDGSPCLGNGGAMLLTAVTSGRIGLAIATVHEFLTNYNINDPFRTLDNWTECRWHTPVCPCGLVLNTQCACVRRSCCNVPQFMSEPSAHGCGTCSTCCSDNHTNSEVYAAARAGIAGSGCYHRHQRILNIDESALSNEEEEA